MYCYRGNFEGHYQDIGFSIIEQPYTQYITYKNVFTSVTM